MHALAFEGSLLRIRVPAGVAAVRMADRDDTLAESEVLLDRDLRFRVTGERFTRDDRDRVIGHVIDVEVVT